MKSDPPRARSTSRFGAFNLATGPVIDPNRLADLVGAKPLTVRPWLARGALATAWHLHLVPVEPALSDLVPQLPLLGPCRARSELGGNPRWSGVDALREMLDGMAEGAGANPPPLAPDTAPRRLAEIAAGVGGRP